MTMMLDAGKIAETAAKLQRRINERFPGSGLANVSIHLAETGRQAAVRVAALSRPHRLLRAVLILVTLAVFAFLAWGGYLAFAVGLKPTDELSAIMQGLDAAVNLMIVLGGASLFLFTLESRFRRAKTLAALHELRSVIHVIDMHQLTKDPSAFGVPRTSSSPARLSARDLLRYLDYCTELLSIAGKVAALYAERVSDPVVIDAVGDIERLTTNMSQKIWQKITMIQNGQGGKDLI